MTVAELIKILEELNPNQEIRYDSYENYGDFPINEVREEKYKGTKYYCIDGDW